MASNLTQATREVIDRTWRSAITYSSPLLTRLLEMDHIVPGGTEYQQIYESADMKSLAQEYGPNDGLDGGAKDIVEKPHWHMAYIQLPIEESVDERVMNAPADDAQLVDLRDKIAKGGMKGMKYKLLDRFYGCAVDNELDAKHTYVQGLPSALIPCGTTAYDGSNYGGIQRTTTTNAEWRSANNTANGTAASINKSNLDTWLDAAREFDDEEGRYLVLMGTTLFNRLKAQFEASNIYKPKAEHAKQGFDSMEYSGVEIAKDRYLDRMTKTTVLHNGPKAGPEAGYVTAPKATHAGLVGDTLWNLEDKSADGTTCVFVLNLNTWHLQYFQDPEGTKAGVSGPFHMTDWFQQDQMIGGVEKGLARIKFKGNLTCDMPNRNLMRVNVS